jgi:Tat protein secretion system quality control protein TatD with DNase activity
VRTSWPTLPKERYAKLLQQQQSPAPAGSSEAGAAAEGAIVKGRCEPCQIVQVAEAVAGLRGLPLAQVAAAAAANSRRVFLRQ